MSRGLFDKWRAVSGSRRDERRPSAVSSPASLSDSGPGAASFALATADESLLALSRELAGLAELPVPAAAKERGWAALQREMERHPLRVTGKNARAAKERGVPAAKGAGIFGTARVSRPCRFRWALASAAGVVAVMAVLLSVYSAGLLQTADTGGSQGTLALAAGSDATSPDTTFVTPSSSEVTVTTGSLDGGSATTESGPAVTGGTQPSGTEGGATVVTNGSATAGGTQSSTPVATSGFTTTLPAQTTLPPQTTTTGQQQMAAAQREGSAKALAVYLADLVVTGNTSGARALVSPEAQASLGYMIASLTDPYGYKVTGASMLGDETVRVTLSINDRVVNNAGEWIEVTKSFVIRVHADDNSAVVMGINAGS